MAVHLSFDASYPHPSPRKQEAALDGPTSLEELCDKVKELMPNRPKVFIGIDGMNGVGKTCLACELAPLLGGTVISLDDHLDKKRGAYAACIRCHEVTAAIEAINGRIVIEGICLRAVAERCGFTIDVHIYVRWVSAQFGLWHDAEICLGETAVDELKQRGREYRRWGAVIDGEDAEQAEEDAEQFHDELIDYHARWRPVQSADAIFTIVPK
jgi:hypothetical protein